MFFVFDIIALQYMSFAVNVSPNIPKILDLTRGHIFQLSLS